MRLEFGFGSGTQSADVPDKNLIGVLLPNEAGMEASDPEAVKNALDSPIESERLRKIVKPSEKIVIVTSDITRPMPTAQVMPHILDELYATGCRPEDITLVFALGSHRKQTLAERRTLAGERAWNEIACIDGDNTDFVHLGDTSRGTPVDIVRAVAEADRRICLGNIEYHYFAGYSGGAKAIMPGVSTRSAIQANHARMVEHSACAGRLWGNPVREDIEEAVSCFCPIDFILNVVLDEHKRMKYAVAGHPVKAHRHGCSLLDRLYQKELERRADIVLCSQGGTPKDLNLYQTQKALDNASHAVRDGGIIVLIGSCREGLGERVFEEWMTNHRSPREIIGHIQRDFQLGGHKAAAIALILERADVYLVSELDPGFVESIFLKPFPTVQDALNAALKKLGGEASILAMPYGGSTLPVEKDCGYF